MNVASSNYKTWLAKAEHDLLNIENNLKAQQIPWDTICFHAQQAAEKYLKALLVFHGQPQNPRSRCADGRMCATRTLFSCARERLSEAELLRGGGPLSERCLRANGIRCSRID